MIEQGTDEWHALRLGKVTASQIVNVMMKPDAAGFQNYRAQLVCERLTGRATETFKSPAMQHGNDTEPQARAMYAMTTGNMVEQVAFIDHPLIAMAGCSPDGLVGELGMIEVKCPQPTEHIRTVLGGSIKRPYALQMQWQMACTGREWCDFVSFCPDLPDELALHVERVAIDHDAIRDMEKAVAEFLAEVDRTVAALRARYTQEAA